MKTKILPLLITTFALASAPISAKQENEWDNRVSVLLGYKNLKSNNFEESNQKAIGIEFDVKKKSWPVSIAVDLLGSGEKTSISGGKVEEVTGGIHLGVRKHWMFTSNVETYLGGGVNYEIGEIKEKTNGASTTLDDNRLGIWFSGGVNWKFRNGFILGSEVRHTNEVDYFSTGTIQPGGLYYGVTLGYSF